jgi:MFS family permease
VVRPVRTPGPWAVVGVSILALGAATFALSAIGALAPKLEAAFNLSRAEIGLVTSLVFVGSVFTSRLGGRLTDERGPARVLGWSLAAFAVAMGLAAAAPDAALFMTAIFFAGLVYGGVNPPTNVVVAGRLQQRRLGFFLSLKQSGVPIGGLVAGAVLPPIAVAFGWRVGFAVGVAACLVAAASTPLLRGATVLRAEGGPTDSPLGRRQVAGLGAFGFVMAGTQWTFLTYLTLYLTERLHFSLSLAGLALVVAQGVGAGARLVWGWASDASGRRILVLLVMTGAQLAGLELLAGNPGRTAVWPIIALAGFTIVGWNGAYYALLAEQAGPARVGRASGDVLAFIFAGSVVLPPIYGVLVDSAGAWRPMWAVAGGVSGLAGLALWGSLREAGLARSLATNTEGVP